MSRLRWSSHSVVSPWERPTFHISLSATTIRTTAEITLCTHPLLHSARLRLTSLRHDMGVPARLLGIGLPLTVVLGALAARLVFSGLGVWFAVLAAACLAPTDAGLGAGIVTNPLVPSRIRRTLNVESGLNDGIVAPLVRWPSPSSPVSPATATGRSSMRSVRSV